jgi:hypothetical protein
MKINIQIEGEDVASATALQRTAPREILEKAAALEAEDAGPAPALIPGTGAAMQSSIEEMQRASLSAVTAIACGQAPKEFQSKAVPEAQADVTSAGPTPAEDAGKAAVQ